MKHPHEHSKHQSPHAEASKSDKTDDHSHSAHKNHAGHDKHAGHSVEMFRDKFWLTLVLAVPTLIWSEELQRWLSYTAPAFPGSSYISAVFGTLVYFYGGWVFLQGGWRELQSRLPGMMTLISLAISVAFLYSLAVTFGFKGHALWWELASLVAIMLLGHWIEMRSIFQAQGALKELAKLLPDTALRLVDEDKTEEVTVDRLQDGDLLLIRPGAAVPADGIVKRGKSSVNEALITGESKPVPKGEGDEVIAGTVNGEGSLRIEVTGTGDKTALAGIMRLVDQAQTSRSRAQALADRAAFYLTLVAIVSGALTFIAWSLAGATMDFTVTRVVTVLVIACPHALGLAVPLVIAISTTLGARGGLLVRDRRGLEEARNLDIVVFDKTGTLTLGEHRVVETMTAEGVESNEALRLAAAVERDSEHPIARALLKSAEEVEIEWPSAQDFQAIPGRGVAAVVEGRKLQVGGPALLNTFDSEIPQALADAADRFGESGRAAIYLAEDDRVLAVFAIADAIRPVSGEAVRLLHDAGIEVAMLTGDSQAVARAVAKELNIDTVFAQVLPEDKVKRIEELQAQGKRVAMVGDGVNDAPALLTADVGIAIGAGTDVAVEAGDVVLVRSDPRDVSRIVNLSKATYRKMVQNLWWAAGYNIVAIPLAAGVLAWAGILLAPAVGAVLMSASTVIVGLNAQLLRRVEL
ncbi:heavy metal translocating P-type ATPase [Methylotuvimicrobium alcaliphilum]|uniref:Copper-exporting P-type ATPase B n=1 Tax=Methylotuvimicrobium alcaliphilum (strain DSM 19304 / NCIMB 14124 / VKM B-2133 / 20Z) TaxID=1091494 RepID=G4SWU5_META2|nr:heavy metal translocating P-type ATPase [Methylotuvimicrobium alcaliphilum]CCE22011.1 putative copper-exporting P-type ATPase B [Methylotuvimicrobium alcaliphilum 20Z]